MSFSFCPVCLGLDGMLLCSVSPCRWNFFRCVDSDDIGHRNDGSRFVCDDLVTV